MMKTFLPGERMLGQDEIKCLSNSAIIVIEVGGEGEGDIQVQERSLVVGE